MRRAAVVFASVLAVGCVPTEFEDLRGEAQVFALDRPSEYPNFGIGNVLAGYGGMREGSPSSRVATTAGMDTPYVSFNVILGDELNLGDTAADGCDSNSPCGMGTSGSMAGFDGWLTGQLCIATPSVSTGDIFIRCEFDSASMQALSTTAPGAGGERFGESAAGLAGNHPFGRAIFGAPGAMGGGAVYRLPDGQAAERLDLSAGMGMGSELGLAVAVGVVDADTAMVAAGGSGDRVIVSTHDVDGGGALTSSVVGCLDDTSPAWGGALAIGDLNGDGTPDLAVVSGVDPNRLDVVRIYDGTQMGAPGTCDASWSAATEIACPAAVDELIDCDASDFGTALAIGDVNADGRADLVVSAPSATVDGTDGAGALFVFEGAAALTDLDDTAMSLRHTAPTANAALGRTVALVPGLSDMGARMEIAAGAPGADKVYVFLCSGLDGDSPVSPLNMRCQPR